MMNMLAALRRISSSHARVPAGVLIGLAQSVHGEAFAQQPNTAVSNPLPGAASRQVVANFERPAVTEFFQGVTPYEFWLVIVVALLGLSIILGLLAVIRSSEGFTAEDAYRPTILLSIVIGAIIVVIGGFSNEQIGPAFALFGTIVGYMLRRAEETVASYRENLVGREDRSGNGSGSPPPPKDAAEEPPASAAGGGGAKQ